jgi:putative transposase
MGKKRRTFSGREKAQIALDALAMAQQMVVPQIISTDQGSRFTCSRFVEAVLDKGSKLSMDGKGRAIDNVFTERFWRTLKYEEVYLNEYRSGTQAWQRTSSYIQRHNYSRPNSSLGGACPAQVFPGERKVAARSITYPVPGRCSRLVSIAYSSLFPVQRMGSTSLSNLTFFITSILTFFIQHEKEISRKRHYRLICIVS